MPSTGFSTRRAQSSRRFRSRIAGMVEPPTQNLSRYQEPPKKLRVLRDLCVKADRIVKTTDGDFRYAGFCKP